jgi:hypothetical protein
MRIAVAILLLIHGVAHLPGFVVPWRLAAMPQMPYKTTLLKGSFDAGDAGIRMVGVLWLLAGLGLVAAAVATLRGSSNWPTITLGVLVFSLALCILGWPDSRIGAALNLVLLAALLVGTKAGWLPAQ